MVMSESKDPILTTPLAQYPVVPMRNMVLYPGQTTPVVVGRPRSRLALESALKPGGGFILLVAQKRDVVDVEPGVEELYGVGVLARIERTDLTVDRAYQVVITALDRFKIESFDEQDGYYVAHGRGLYEVPEADQALTQQVATHVRALATEIFSQVPGNFERLRAGLQTSVGAAELGCFVAQHLDLKVAHKQTLLEMVSPSQRLHALLDHMIKLREEIALQKEVNQKLSSRLGKQHRDALLREHIRTLQDELGERSSGQPGDLAERIEAANMPDDVAKVAREQLSRLDAMGNQAAESHVIRNYLEILLALPWNDPDPAEIDLELAQRILDEDHFGLKKIKRRILEHLAVLKLRASKGSLLLLVGPPGVGKTSLGRSIARAMGRKFVRVSLGGVRDDAEIRGHRRTYVGAQVGRIIDGIKRAGERNPVFVLDEIDKLARGYGGDPAAALLEVLDPEQNSHFVDHFLDVGFDLSQVFFIATANSTDTIPAALLDRMEIIRLSGYTVEEKMHIARAHLVPKQLSKHGMTADQLVIEDEALKAMIQGYTRESGVRELQRLVAATIRARAERVLRQRDQTKTDQAVSPVEVHAAELDDMIGPEIFTPELVQTHVRAGVSTGLAWTPMGGDILFIESSRMPGRGKLTITGQLGDVMRESAQIALSLVRSRLVGLHHRLDFAREDFHVHVPAGAIPKDGPSAGLAMLSAVASLVLDRPIDTKIAMTGEITLRGAVMPVGGIKEKVIAAHRAGVRKVLLPKRNEKDLRDVPDSVRAELEFVFAETIEEAINATLGLEPMAWTGPIRDADPSFGAHPNF